MSPRLRLGLLTGLMVILVGISAWVNIPPWLTRKRAVEHYEAGQKFAREGLMDSAVAQWRIAVRLDPDYPAPYRSLGAYLMDTAQRPDLASAVYGRLAVVDPDGPHVYCRFAKALAQRNELGEARQYAHLAVRKEPRCGLSHSILGAILMTDQHFKQGLAELERSVEIEPRNTQFAMILAQAYLDTSNLPAARRILENIARKEPRNAKAHFLSGWTFARMPRSPENVRRAIDHFASASRVDADDPDVFGEWGKLLLESGRPEEASRRLERAWSLNPRIVQVAHNLSAAYRMMGEREKARKMRARSDSLVERATRMRVLLKKLTLEPTSRDLSLQLADMEIEDGNLSDALRYVQGVLRQRPDDRRALRLLARVYTVGGKPEMADSVLEHLKKLPDASVR